MLRKKSKILIAIALFLVLIGIAVSVTLSKMTKDLESLATASIKMVDLSRISDGVHQGVFASGPVSVKVDVTVQDHRIMKIDLIEHKNGQGKPGEAVIELVVASQTLQVDTIAGATYSSKAILKAIEDALQP